MINYLLLIICSYLLGSIPFGLITTKIMGTGDIRKMGSGNIGATNVLRTTGIPGGIITLLLDAIKGVIPVLIAKSWWGINSWTLLVALAAIVGHNYPIYLKFKGGKGVATSLGIIIALWPYAGLTAIGIWLASVIIWRYSSLAALISFVFLPINILLVERNMTWFIFSLIVSAMIFYRHRDNISRLRAGKEKKIGRGSSSTVLLLIVAFILCNKVCFAGEPAHTSTIPPEIQKIWDERRAVISTGDNVAGDAKIEKIIEMRYMLGINSIEEISALLVREGYQALENGMPEDAYRLSNKAKEISIHYAPAYFLSASSLLKMSNIMASISEYANAIKVSLQDFWYLFNLTGNLYTIVVIALSFTFFTFLMAWMLRILPLYFHTFREVTAGFIDRPLCKVFFFTITVLPLMFGIGWFILFWIACVWIYLTRKEKMAAILIVAFFLSLPYTIKYETLYITSQDNITLQGLLAVERGYGNQELIDRLKDKYKDEQDNIYLPLSIASLLYKQGSIKESLDYYNRLIETDKKDIRVWALNNMGNTYFKSGEYNNAIVSYKKAIEDSRGSAIPIYNLSQVYREKLMFAEAESTYEEAKKISPSDIGRYTTLATKGKGYKVIDFPVTKHDLWIAALRPGENYDSLTNSILRAIIKIPTERFFFLGLSIVIILTVLSYLSPRTPLAYNCPGCGQIVCGWCSGSRIFGNPCKGCRGKGDVIEKTKDLDRRISFILPGIWHMYKGLAGTGWIISFLFFMGVSGFFLVEANDTWNMAYNVNRWFVMGWLILILLSYLILTIHFKYIKIRFNS